MNVYAKPVARLIDHLARLPGIGPKTAQRLAFHLLNAPAEVALSLARAVEEARSTVRTCSSCGYLTDQDPVLFAVMTGAGRIFFVWWNAPGTWWPWKKPGVSGGFTMSSRGLFRPWKGSDRSS